MQSHLVFFLLISRLYIQTAVQSDTNRMESIPNIYRCCVCILSATYFCQRIFFFDSCLLVFRLTSESHCCAATLLLFCLLLFFFLCAIQFFFNVNSFYSETESCRVLMHCQSIRDRTVSLNRHIIHFLVVLLKFNKPENMT